MKRPLIIIFILLIIPASPRILDFVGTNYSLLITPAFGQEQVFDFARAYQDYTYTYDQYRIAQADYVAARQAYLNYKTLTSKTEALSQTLRLLKLRDEAIKTYLTALRMKLAETTGITNYEQNILYLKLDDHVSWYADHQQVLPSAGTLEDLVDSAEEAQSKYDETEVIIYQSLGTILAGKETSLRGEIYQTIADLKKKLVEIRQVGDKETAVSERWLLEAENRLTRSQEKQLAAQQLLTTLKAYKEDKKTVYNQAQYLLEESHQYLKEANFYLRELIREVKSAD